MPDSGIYIVFNKTYPETIVNIDIRSSNIAKNQMLFTIISYHIISYHIILYSCTVENV